MIDYHIQSIRNRPGATTKVTTQVASFKDFLLYIALGAAFIALFFWYSWQHLTLLSLHYQVEQIRQENDTLREQNRALALEQASLESPQRIDSVARERLGMQPIQQGNVVLLSEMDLADTSIVAQVSGVPNSRLRSTKTTAEQASPQ